MDEFLMNWKLNEIIDSWDEPDHEPTPDEEAVVSTLLLIEGRSDDLLILSNRYARADAAVITGLYVLDAMRKRSVSNTVQGQFIRKLRKASCRLFDIQAAEMEKLMNNRLGVFFSLIRNAKSTSSIADEAALLFAYDLKYDRYIEFRPDSPVLLLDFSVRMQIEAESHAFFQAAFPLVTESVNKYGSPKSQVPAPAPRPEPVRPAERKPTPALIRKSAPQPTAKRSWYDAVSWNALCSGGLVIGIVLAILISVYVNAASAVPTDPPKTTPEATESTALKLVSHPVPVNGRIFENLTIDGCAPFTVSAGSNVYLVLDPVDLSANITNGLGQQQVLLNEKYMELRVFIRSGMTFETDVPLGSYEVYYATGDTWYGEEELFGPDTRYYKCDGTFDFTQDSEGYNGWTLTLTAVYGGNLDTDLVDESDFPK